MLQRSCCSTNAPPKVMRGDHVHKVSDQTYNCPHNDHPVDDSDHGFRDHIFLQHNLKYSSQHAQ
ncbi:hypothetical protein M433DRAFT_153179 [Acidomyces richmondensis BFW]|nr:hypothetical protein M433DRAFT_153179 [Acidomyces richmondensis BFW]